MVLPKHLIPVVDDIKRLNVTPPPEPWKVGKVLYVGGLIDIGFSAKSDLLLVISHDGRSVLDCLSNKQVARDRDNDFHFDIMSLEAEGIGPLSGERIRTAGLHGGGLSRQTDDCWVAEELSLEWPESTLILVSPGSSILGKAFGEPTNYFKVYIASEVRAWGFSPTGKSLVLATSSDLRFWYR
jgi:hypothetical protein